MKISKIKPLRALIVAVTRVAYGRTINRLEHMAQLGESSHPINRINDGQDGSEISHPLPTSKSRQDPK